MQIKKSHLETFQRALVGTNEVLNFADSRVRDSFLKPLTEALQTYIESRDIMLKKLCVAVEGKENQYTLTPEYLKELDILNSEEVELDADPKIKDFIELSTYKPRVGEMDLIDDIKQLF